MEKVGASLHRGELRIGCWCLKKVMFGSNVCFGTKLSRTYTLDELPGLLNLSWIVKRSVTYSFQLEQCCSPASQNRACVLWFVCFAQDDLWTGELTNDPSALILSAAISSNTQSKLLHTSVTVCLSLLDHQQPDFFIVILLLAI